MENKRKLLVDLNQLKLLEERIRRQMSRVLWLYDTDRNTAYCHKVALSRRRANVITLAMVGLKEDASVTDIKMVVVSAF